MRRKRLIRRGLVALGSAVVTCAVGFGVYDFHHPKAAFPTLHVETLLGPETVESRRFRTIPAKGQLSSAEQTGLRLWTHRGVQITMAPKSQVELSALERDEQNSRLTLMQGSVSCQVPKLSRGNRFTIETPSTEIIVHGTVFSVQVQGPSGPDCVKVTEGLVEVRHRDTTVLLRRGQSHGCAIPLVTPSSEPSTPQSVANPSPTVEKAASSKRFTVSGSEGSSLPTETRLLKRALVAERRGQFVEAGLLFSTFLQKFPNSPLMSEARAGYERTTKLQP
jgi:hypothetical protein